MAKEITHILVAQDVLKQMGRIGQVRCARTIERNKDCFFAGALIPDAVYYDVPPFRTDPLKHGWMAKSLHGPETAANDENAMGLFRRIGDQPGEWPLKLSFAAGIVTHTAVDRIFHEAIDQYTAAWAKIGSPAVAVHRQMETLLDLLFLEELNMGPHAFLRYHLSPLEDRQALRLCRLYLTGLAEQRTHPDGGLVHALKRAQWQQRLFLRLFAARRLSALVRAFNRLADGRLDSGSSLFYSHSLNVKDFPVLKSLGSNAWRWKSMFRKEAIRLRAAATRTALRNIQEALLSHA